jgi:hypothetical protein
LPNDQAVASMVKSVLDEPLLVSQSKPAVKTEPTKHQGPVAITRNGGRIVAKSFPKESPQVKRDVPTVASSSHYPPPVATTTSYECPSRWESERGENLEKYQERMQQEASTAAYEERDRQAQEARERESEQERHAERVEEAMRYGGITGEGFNSRADAERHISDYDATHPGCSVS